MTGTATVTTARWELIRALGAVADSPEAARAAVPALLLAPVPADEHTDVFVLNLPPYAAVYLGPDGGLGGEAAERIAGFWRVLGLDPPGEPDHLSALLGLYVSLGEAGAEARRPATADALNRAQGTLLTEHLLTWLPPYLDAVRALPAPALAQWGLLLGRVIEAEASRHPALPGLPLALREAPTYGLEPEAGTRELAHALTVPVRSGIILTRPRLAEGARDAGVGLRAGERRYALRFMLEQDLAATAGWLAAEADEWVRRHRGRRAADEAAHWWSYRAWHTARTLRELAGHLAAPAAAAS